jgi:hypothetical protein
MSDLDRLHQCLAPPRLKEIKRFREVGVSPEALSAPELPARADVVFHDDRPLFDFVDEVREVVLRWRDGVFVLDLAPTADQMQADAAAERAFLEILADFARSGRHVSDKKSNAFAPALFAEHPGAKGLRTARLNAAMQRLFAANRIHNEISGPPSKRRERIVVGPPPAAADETDGPPPAPADETEMN